MVVGVELKEGGNAEEGRPSFANANSRFSLVFSLRVFPQG
jgi:hypothetical protein